MSDETMDIRRAASAAGECFDALAGPYLERDGAYLSVSVTWCTPGGRLLTLNLSTDDSDESVDDPQGRDHDEEWVTDFGGGPVDVAVGGVPVRVGERLAGLEARDVLEGGRP